MLIKAADDKTKRLRLLEDLQASQRLDAKQKEWLSTELWNTRTGIQGEKNAAHYLDNHLSASKNWMVLHDLRVSVDGEVAQIDHLLVGRTWFLLLETKTFGGDITVNEHGEFSVQYPGQRIFHIPSPFEQSRRHGNVLQKLLERLDILPRIGRRHRMEHVVLVDPKRAIRRPPAKSLDTNFLIKADQFPEWHKKWSEKDDGFFDVVSMLADVRGQDTIKEWAERILRQHRPASLLDLPEFMAPKAEPVHAVPAAPASTPAPTHVPVARVTNGQPPPDESIRRKLVCATCRTKITFPEGKFCWSQEQRFGGYQYCREHQAAFK